MSMVDNMPASGERPLDGELPERSFWSLEIPLERRSSETGRSCVSQHEHWRFCACGSAYPAVAMANKELMTGSDGFMDALGRSAKGSNANRAAQLRVMATELIHQSLTKLGVWTSQPWAFLTVPIYGLLWFVFDRESLNWHGVALLATWFMTLVIQRAEHRDMQAVHAKLDELLRAEDTAKSELSDIDRKESEEIERHRERARGKDN
jgi:low affinity Fe/Cu permease